MNISQAKLINLVDFLEQEGHKAVKQRGHIYWYKFIGTTPQSVVRAHLLSRLTPAEMNGMTMV